MILIKEKNLMQKIYIYIYIYAKEDIFQLTPKNQDQNN